MELVEKLKNQYGCYYFKIHIAKGDIRFDYRIHAGIGGETNAILLLSKLGFPSQVINAAMDL